MRSARLTTPHMLLETASYIPRTLRIREKIQHSWIVVNFGGYRIHLLYDYIVTDDCQAKNYINIKP